MEKSTAYIGEWWLPDNEKNRIGGTLTIIENKNFELQLVGDFSVDEKEIDCILGYATKTTENNRNSFILYRTHQLSTASIGFIKSKYSVYRLLQTSSGNEKIISHFSGCNIISKNFAKIHNLTNIKKKSEDNLQFNIQTGELKKFPLFENLHKSISFNVGLNYKIDRDEISIKDISSIKINYKQVVEISEIDIDRKIIDAFFTIITDNPTYSDDILLYDNLENKSFAKIPFQLKEKNNLFTSKFNTALDYEVLFKLEELCKNDYLLKFYNFFTRNELIMGYFIDNKFNENLQIENRFLNIISALEIYSRSIQPDRKIKESYQIIRNRILDNCSKNDKAWLDKRLKETIQLKLEDRFLNLLNKFLPDYESFLLVDLDKIIETRHKLVHLKVKNPEKVIIDDIELFKLCNKLEILFSKIVLTECGFNIKQTKEAFNKLIENRSYL